MLYYLFEYLDQNTSLPGTGLFQYISFRSALAFAFSLLISTIYGRKIIDKLRNLQVENPLGTLVWMVKCKRKDANNGWAYYYHGNFDPGFSLRQTR